MWVCEHCGCQGIAGDLLHCPGCGQDRVTRQANEAPTGSEEHEAEQRPAAAATADTSTVVPEVAAFIGEQGPELWDISTLPTDNLAATSDDSDGGAPTGQEET